MGNPVDHAIVTPFVAVLDAADLPRATAERGRSAGDLPTEYGLPVARRRWMG